MVVAAYDFAGKQLWLVRPGEFTSTHGYCSSPVLFEDLVIVNGDHDGDSYIVALKQATARSSGRRRASTRPAATCTPIIRDDRHGRTQMILSGSKSVASYDPRDRRADLEHRRPDRAVRRLDGRRRQAAVHDGRLSRPSHPGDQARRPRQRDRLGTSSGERKENCSYVPSPIVCGEYFLVVTDKGIASCFKCADGERMWIERIGPNHSASLVTAGGLVYFTSDRGTTTVVRPGPVYEAVAVNELKEDCYSSPAVSGGKLYFRADAHLYCIGK